MKRLLALSSLLFALAAPVCSHADDTITTDDEIAIRQAVESQLKAFAQDDAAKAFELATEDTRTRAGTPDNFLRLIREHFNPIYRFTSVIFSRPEMVDGLPVQLVRVADNDGKVWLALFSMQHEADGSWKIDDCRLFETSSVST